MKYPTKEEIEECKTIPSEEQNRMAIIWKNFHTLLGTLENQEERKIAIQRLCEEMLKTENYHNVNIQFAENNDNIPCSCFIANQNKIYLKNTSIITALHEVAHALFGADETKACSWSTKLFKIMFPEEYKKLHWEGHMLKK